ncbi:hypothetical protein RhiirA4_550582 [Rhizophagus irregularis]|uniref:Zinc-binding domain-containing protein n=1 Tax=Rhizophagus irregularis TaxID=588596 RepID=A0A2I1HMW3_9GLOM|nr:hypothetical protein RhiirA4_550582 [Rhizophagus irregularis]
MRNTKKRCVNFLMNWRLVLQQLLSTCPMRPPKVSIRTLISPLQPFKDQVKIVPEKLIQGKNGRGNLDYGIESRRKRKANEMDNEHGFDKILLRKLRVIEGECLSEEYVNNKAQMLWKCAKDHVWSANLNYVKNSKTWCSCCAVENRHIRTIEDMRKSAEKKGKERRRPHKWKASAKDILKGTWCQRCSTPGRKRVIPNQKIISRQYCTRTSGKCLSTDYVNTDTPMLWRCGKGHEWSTTLYQIKNMRSWCSQSAGKFPRGLTEAKEIAHSRGGMYLSTEYINLCVPMQWKCNKSHKWFASFNGIRHAKTWCPVDA